MATSIQSITLATFVFLLLCHKPTLGSTYPGYQNEDNNIPRMDKVKSIADIPSIGSKPEQSVDLVANTHPGHPAQLSWLFQQSTIEHVESAEKSGDFMNSIPYINKLNPASHSNDKIKNGKLLTAKKQIAQTNLEQFPKRRKLAIEQTSYIPTSPVSPITLPTLRGKFEYPGNLIKQGSAVLFHSYNPDSGFCDCLWECPNSIANFLRITPNNTHYVFISNSPNAYNNSLWMSRLFENVIAEQGKRGELLLERLHFVTVPLMELGSWIPQLLWQWSCPDHNCGLDQVWLQSPDIMKLLKRPLVTKRLDARYDWLPSPTLVFGNRSMPVTYVVDGCVIPVPDTSLYKGSVVLVPQGNCSYSTLVSRLQQAGAAGVLVIQKRSSPIQDMNCHGAECLVPISIPATMIPWNNILTGLTNGTVRYQKTPSENFFFAIDHHGRLAEVGWFLYPDFQFLAWQAQWFEYMKNLERHQSQQADVLEISIFNGTVMQGKNGSVSTVTLPPLSELQQYSEVELDARLSCPGGLDEDCPHWDHTVQLYVCCDPGSPLCGMELGRWITPFRRRIGHWVTSVRSLLPLITSSRCTFSMKTSPWAMPWNPFLMLRFSNKFNACATFPAPLLTVPLYFPAFTFDLKYNSHFIPMTFTPPQHTTKVELVAVITGHGSDENGCGEFCVTSHHFVINNRHSYNRTFSNAGTPLGCADRVLEGVEPNEHGTWLYGRDGWCDGQQVSPWVTDITAVVRPGQDNSVFYYGWYNGTDPNPKHNPGIMGFYSYLTFYSQQQAPCD